MFERFTTEARQVVVDSRTHAARLGHFRIGSEHLLLAVASSPTPAGAVIRSLGVTPAALDGGLARLLATPNGTLDRDALAAIGIDLDTVVERIENAFGPGALTQARIQPHRSRWRRRRRSCQDRLPSGQMQFTPGAKKCLELSLRQALALRQGHIGVEHIALALASLDEGLAPGLLEDLGVSPDQLRSAVTDHYRQAG